MIRIPVTLFLLLPLLVFGQPDTLEKVLTFRVKQPETKITIEPGHDILYLNDDNELKITVSGPSKITNVELAGGEITKVDSLDDVYIAKVTEGVEAILSIHETFANGRTQKSLVRPYKIVRVPDVEILVSGVVSDSAVDKFHLIATGNLKGRFRKTGQQVQILAFELEIAGDNQLDTLRSLNGLLTLEMRRRIDKTEPGRLLTFRNIYFRTLNGKIRKAPPVRIYLVENKKESIGF